MRRGEVYRAELRPRSGSEQRGVRPVIVLSTDALNRISTWRLTRLEPNQLAMLLIATFESIAIDPLPNVNEGNGSGRWQLALELVEPVEHDVDACGVRRG